MDKIAILGAGAIGQLLHHQLLAQVDNSCIDLYLFTRQNMLSKQLTVEPLIHDSDSNNASKILDDVQWVNCDTQVVATQQILTEIDLVIVAVKAYQVEQALTPLLDYLKPTCHILLIHNGMGPHLAIAPELDGRGMSLGTTSQAALKLSPSHIKQTGTGLTQVGHYCGQPLQKQLTQILQSSIPNLEWVEDVLAALWQKLAINAAINPLTALHNCPNGDLAQPKYRQSIINTVQELCGVAAAEGVILNSDALLSRVFSVIELTQANYSSMHQDIAHQRQTEIMAISGYIVARANAHGIAAPCSQAMLNDVEALSLK